jgi:hypothetical protein
MYAKESRNPLKRRTLAEAMRAPQWHRLIVTIHKAQEAAGFDGRHFGADEMRFFGETLVGMPWELPEAKRVYWTARQELVHSDGTRSVRYVVKCWDSETPAIVDTIAESESVWNPTEEEDAALLRDYAARAAFQVGGKL